MLISARDLTKTYTVGDVAVRASDYPELAAWLVGLGIDSVSLNPDVAIRTTTVIYQAEQALQRSR